MPRRNDLHRILIIGSGPIVIGQACEFDYSGTQAAKALRADGFEVVLVNSNPATIMTDPDLADQTYVEPLTAPYLEEIIRRERPDALLSTVGGQTGLNLAVELAEAGILDKYGVELIGAKIDAIKKAEDRLLFKDAMRKIGLETPESQLINSLERGQEFAAADWLPVHSAAQFHAGRHGRRHRVQQEDLDEILERGLALSPVHEVLIEESALGWKEFELEVMRDLADNCIIVCSIENFDAMGVHTGDSITVAPAQTLTDREYQMMRDAAIGCLREIGVDTGGSNVQFAINPANGRMVIIEMNPRVSRSSALASKATGFPIAKIAAKLAVGYRLDEISNDITRKTPACFEPTIDYVVAKIPKWAFEKFPGADSTLGTQMKSVGEVMAIGRTFKQALWKGMRSLETGKAFGSEKFDAALIAQKLITPTPDRLGYIRFAMANGYSVEEIQEMTAIDPWFLRQMKEVVDFETELREATFAGAPAALLRRAKRYGISDAQLSKTWGVDEQAVRSAAQGAGRGRCFQSRGHVRRGIRKLHAVSLFQLRKRVRGRAVQPQEGHDPGQRSQPHRAGHRVRLLLLPRVVRAAGNGRRVDHGELQSGDRFDRLRHQRPALLRAADARKCFQHLRHRETGRRDRAVRRADAAHAGAAARSGSACRSSAPIRRTSIWRRTASYSANCSTIWVSPAPANGTATNAEEACAVARRIGYPVLVRPSYVLGGRAMVIAYDEEMVRRYMREAVTFSQDRPVLIDRFLEDATEVDVDALADSGGGVLIAGIMEHIEEAGVHSGDSSCVLPPQSLAGADVRDHRRLHRAAGARAERDRPDERAVRDQRRHGVRARGQSARVAHGALRQQGHRRAAAQDRGGIDVGPQAGRLRAPDGRSDVGHVDGSAGLRQIAGVPVQQISRRRSGARSGNAIHRRSDGSGDQFRRGVSARRRSAPALRCRKRARSSSASTIITKRTQWTLRGGSRDRDSDWWRRAARRLRCAAPG